MGHKTSIDTRESTSDVTFFHTLRVSKYNDTSFKHASSKTVGNIDWWDWDGKKSVYPRSNIKAYLLKVYSAYLENEKLDLQTVKYSCSTVNFILLI